MNLKEYFLENRGVGVMATSDGSGVVSTAIYSRPHVADNGNVAFIMRDRLTHSNLQENAHASYLFLEKGEGYNGVRLFLTKFMETDDKELISSMVRRKRSGDGESTKEKTFLVSFQVDKVVSLIGGEEVILNENDLSTKDA